MSLSTRILIGLGLGLSGGIVYSLIDLPALHLLPVLIEPVGALWVNGIRMTVIPLLMSLLITAIAGQSNTGGVAQLGTKTLGLFVVMIICACLYTLLLAPFFLSLLDIDPADSKALLAVTHTDKFNGTWTWGDGKKSLKFQLDNQTDLTTVNITRLSAKDLWGTYDNGFDSPVELKALD